MKVLIAFYSRSGVTRSAAELLSAELRSRDVEAEVEEIIDTKDRSGITGWLGGGKDATLKRATEIQPVKADLAAFDLVAIGTPVWAWTAAPAAREFARQHGASCKKVAFFCTMGGSGDKGTFKALTELCAKNPATTLALIDRAVKEKDEEKYLAPIRAFADRIAAGA